MRSPNRAYPIIFKAEIDLNKCIPLHIKKLGNIVKRIVATLPKDTINDMIAQFKAHNPHIQYFTDIKQDNHDCGPKIALSDIFIDEIVQRSAIIRNFIDWISNFEENMVNAPTIYQCKNKHGKLAWFLPIDGQHRLLLYYFIVVYILKEDPRTCFISISLKSFHDAKTASRLFKTMNSNNSSALTDIEIFIHDSKTENQWKVGDDEYAKAKEVTDTLASGGYEIVSKNTLADLECKKNPVHRVVEFNKYPASHTEWFIKYRTGLGAIQKSVPVSSKELALMFKYIDLCIRQDITISARYFKDLGIFFKNHCGADFSSNEHSTNTFWDGAEIAHQNWVEDERKLDPGFSHKFSRTPDGIGLAYIIQQLRQHPSFTRPMPVFNITARFKLQRKDYWK